MGGVGAPPATWLIHFAGFKLLNIMTANILQRPLIVKPINIRIDRRTAVCFFDVVSIWVNAERHSMTTHIKNVFIITDQRNHDSGANEN